MTEDPRTNLASLYRELMDDPLRVAGPGELDGDEPAPDACDHRWNFVKDWYGDPNVINGTADCSFWRCRKCGEESSTQPDDYIEPEPPEREPFESFERRDRLNDRMWEEAL